MTRFPAPALRRAVVSRVAAGAALAALCLGAAACSHPSTRPGEATPGARASTADPQSAGTPGRISVRADDVSLDITAATAHLDASGDGTLTMTVHNGSAVPEHLDMVATPGGGRGALRGGPAKGSGSLEDAGISLRPGSTVTFGGAGHPTITFTHVTGVTAARTLPLALEFGVARLVHLTARVAGS